MSTIIFLGTAGDASTVGRQLRGSGGIVIQEGEIQLHLDPGPGSLVRAREFGVNVRGNTAILLSSSNLYCSHDLNAVIDAMTLGGLDKQGIVVAQQDHLQLLADSQKKQLERIITLKPPQKIGIADIEVNAFDTSKSQQGFLITLPSLKVGYSGMSSYNTKLTKGLAGANVLILSMPNPGDSKEHKGMNRVDAIKVIEKVKPQLVILTHFGLELLKADPLEESRAIQRATRIQTVAAHDGLKIAPASYDAKQRQQRLANFKAATQ